MFEEICAPPACGGIGKFKANVTSQFAELEAGFRLRNCLTNIMS